MSPDPGSPSPGADHPHTRKSALADDVYRLVREELLARRTPPGERINVDALARDLHMSTTPVRDALLRLETDGLVRKVPNRGFLASPLLDTRTIAEIYDFRMMLEPILVGRAARRGDAAFADALKAQCDPDAIEEVLSTPENEAAVGRGDIQFHTSIAAHAGNPVATEALTAAFERSITYSLGYSHTAVRTAWEEHRVIASAIIEGDPDKAADAMRNHLRNGLQRFQEAIS